MRHKAANKRIRSCLNAVINAQPFFGSLALRMPLEENESVGSLVCDGEMLEYNPQWVEDTHGDIIKAAICRMTIACTLKHHTRRGDRDLKTWNDASLEACLPLLKDAGMLNGEAHPTNSDLDINNSDRLVRAFYADDDAKARYDKSVEKIYDELYVEYPPQQKPQEQQNDDQQDDNDQQDDDQSGPGLGHGSGDQDNQDDNDDQQQDDQQQDGDSQSQDNSQQQQQQQQSFGEIKDAPAKTDAEMKEIEKQVDESVLFAQQFAKSKKSEPGKAEAFITQEIIGGMNAKLDWRAILRRYMTEAAPTDYTWARPNRRHIHAGMYLPALHSDAVGDFVLAIDTSASMDEDQLAEIWAEIHDAVQIVKPSKITVIQCSHSIASVESYEPHELPIDLDAKGRGGTAFTPVFDHIDENEQDVKFLMYFTDLEVDSDEYPEIVPHYPVLWLQSTYKGNISSYASTPPFGDVLLIE